ncbi:Methylcrotonyl-CoA carboxylase biotin-containing subunit [hydrothermal vent metagenome]|uniref:Methylcrotonyl-CoA carboxylase biotin-containing subunit n=1 Tax=hydrothermal vent metagenome TaxID=652676 RepID=A0A3B0TNF1_9ZZZZ
MTLLKKILIANRGEIACRIIKTAHRMGIECVAVYSEADRNALHVQMADQAAYIGPSPASQSYLLGELIVAAALETGADAIHPGYGFLSENPDFVDQTEAAGLIFIGPSADAMRKMGLKDAAKKLMQQAGVPVVPGYHGSNQQADFLAAQAEKTGFPVLIKARAGGGGKGMRQVNQAKEFYEALASAQREGQASFGDPGVLIEKLVASPRHIEVQIFGDNHGNVIHLFERDCSLQRRHQKVIEEAPAPGMSSKMRAAMTNAAVKAAKAINYSGAGTIEFIVDGALPLSPERFWFMEMNTRLQVEHPVTEAISGHDLVEWQIRVAAGEQLPETQQMQKINGHAFEARLYAEDPANGFAPSTGSLAYLRFGAGRKDSGVVEGDQISPFYDPMIAKLITHAPTRAGALAKLRAGLAATHIAGVKTNLAFLGALSSDKDFSDGNVDTGLIGRKIDALTSPGEPDGFIIVCAAIMALNLDLDGPYTGWRLWGEARHSLELVFNKEPLSITISFGPGRDLRLHYENRELVFADISRTADKISARINSLLLSAKAVRYPARLGMEEISVLSNGRTFVFEVPDPLAPRAADANNDDHLSAPMSGVVRIVDVKDGDIVEAGARLLVIEAMKMELALCAPRACIIDTVLCRELDAVEEGAVLVRFAEITGEK